MEGKGATSKAWISEGERDRSGIHAGERRRKPSHAKYADHPECTTQL